MASYSLSDHTFMVCAYKESEFLGECVESLLAQTLKSNIVIATSTPNEHIKSIASKYDIELRVNNGIPGISSDWNFAYKQADTRLVTLVHQDDIYLPDYLSTALNLLSSSDNPIIFFSHYAEIKDGKTVCKTWRMSVKKLLLWPLKIFKKSRFIRRRILSLGNPICCPSVTYANMKDLQFSDEFRCVLDWELWEELSKKKGSFVYCEKPLICHRVHDDAENTKMIQDNSRATEDYAMFRKFWPTPIAKLIMVFYRKRKV